MTDEDVTPDAFDREAGSDHFRKVGGMTGTQVGADSLARLGSFDVRRRTAGLKRRSAFLVSLLALFVLSGCTGAKPQAAPSPKENASVAADAGQVRVVESGFQMTDPVSGSGQYNRELVGIVLENTSKQQQAHGTALEFDIFDEAGQTLYASPMLHLGFIAPGARFGVGMIVSSTDPATKGRKAVRMQAKVGGSDWDLPTPQRTITLSNVKFEPQADGSVNFRYTAQIRDMSGWEQKQLPLINVVFRDSGGKVIGGVNFGHQEVPGWQTGTSSQSIPISAIRWKSMVPAGADLSRTEAYGALDGG
jgi:hypothetical protein